MIGDGIHGDALRYLGSKSLGWTCRDVLQGRRLDWMLTHSIRPLFFTSVKRLLWHKPDRLPAQSIQRRRRR